MPSPSPMKSVVPPPAPEPTNSEPSQLTISPDTTSMPSSVASPHVPVAELPRANKAKVGMISMVATSHLGMVKFVLSRIHRGGDGYHLREARQLPPLLPQKEREPVEQPSSQQTLARLPRPAAVLPTDRRSVPLPAR